MVSSNPVVVQAVEVVSSKLSIRHPFFENVVSVCEYGMSDRDNRALLPPTASESTILCLKVRPLLAGCSPCHLNQCCLQPAVAVSGSTALPLPSTFVVAGADLRPRTKVGIGRERVHIRPDLSEHALRRHPVIPRHRNQSRDRFLRKGVLPPGSAD